MMTNTNATSVLAKILFTGDVCVNGPNNYVGDGDVGKWVATLNAARKLDAKVVCTGDGARSIGTVLDDQHAFFKGVREQVGALRADRAAEEATAPLESTPATP